jgi:TRAP-type C4-dicarboxylate transport system substrate-binding protein
MKLSHRLCCLFVICAFCLAPLAAQRQITVKLVSQVPENTPWGKVLNRLATEWAQATNNEVKLQVYHNSKSGDPDIIRQLNMNQIQIAMLSSFGLRQIAPEVMTISCPFLIRDNAELDKVLAEIKPGIDKKIESKGYHPLAWSKIGWVRFFSKKPVYVPADLKAQKLGTSETEPELLNAFKAMGFNMVPIAMNQILVNLSGGLIDAVYQTPVTAGGLQIFGLAKNMTSVRVAPFMGAIIINQRTWNRIPAKYRPELERLCKKAEAELDTDIQTLEADILKTMVDYGLVVNEVSPAQTQVWYDEFNAAMPKMIGLIFDRATYDRIAALLKR